MLDRLVKSVKDATFVLACASIVFVIANAFTGFQNESLLVAWASIGASHLMLLTLVGLHEVCK